ncbi:tRNA lysidine(34) synthetase TilS [Prevotella dentasini]|uniref:tRNA lysidine(34) synthetase TilS n=1 Tax=Prevotella dentasini TaxID=589537 RepID=UPI00046901BC|nr:tRNA lysidine(34) synthetase TilS [Prevotella dentasini]
MLNKVSEYIARHGLLDKSKPYIVALSGGADSVSLLLVLKSLGYRVEAAHCNFQLRGKESFRDEDFCRKLCKERNVPFHLIHFDTRTYASLHKVSIEMAARDLRYRYFEELRKDMGAEAICVAHHRDDSIETVLLNLIRGTGLNGLTGIKPRHGCVVRPLLCCSHDEIMDYLRLQQQDYVTDSSNLVNDVMRNKIRLDLLPLLETMNPSVRTSLVRMAGRLAEANKITEASLQETADSLTTVKNEIIQWETDKINSYISPGYLLFYLLSPHGFNSVQIEEITRSIGHAQTGKSWQSATHELIVDRACLLLTPLRKREDKIMKLPETGKYVYSEDLAVKVETSDFTDNFIIPHSKDTVVFDKDKVSFPLILRKVQAGDRFTPFGMNGSKLVSDFLTDIKANAIEKRTQTILTDSRGEILWLVGKRIAHPYRISDNTREVLKITIC